MASRAQRVKEGKKWATKGRIQDFNKPEEHIFSYTQLDVLCAVWRSWRRYTQYQGKTPKNQEKDGRYTSKADHAFFAPQGIHVDLHLSFSKWSGRWDIINQKPTDETVPNRSHAWYRSIILLSSHFLLPTQEVKSVAIIKKDICPAEGLKRL